MGKHYNMANNTANRRALTGSDISTLVKAAHKLEDDMPINPGLYFRLMGILAKVDWEALRTDAPAAGGSPVGLRAIVQQAKKEHGATERLTALLALSDNGNDISSMSMEGLALWEDGAVIIAELMGSEDEARFTLYDYIDALCNTDACIIKNASKWLRELHEAYDKGDTSRLHEIFLQLTELAEYKRNVYSHSGKEKDG